MDRSLSPSRHFAPLPHGSPQASYTGQKLQILSPEAQDRGSWAPHGIDDRPAPERAGVSRHTAASSPPASLGAQSISSHSPCYLFIPYALHALYRPRFPQSCARMDRRLIFWCVLMRRSPRLVQAILWIQWPFVSSHQVTDMHRGGHDKGRILRAAAMRHDHRGVLTLLQGPQPPGVDAMCLKSLRTPLMEAAESALETWWGCCWSMAPISNCGTIRRRHL
jgi:hypothetical protein